MTAKRGHTAEPHAIGSALRDPANRLYDEACSLLAAAEGLRHAAEGPDAAPALVATLGCVEASLEAIAIAVSHMHCSALALYDERDDEVRKRLHEAGQISAAFATLKRNLSASRMGCEAARRVTGRLLADR
jgi:hypothetical protein